MIKIDPTQTETIKTETNGDQDSNVLVWIETDFITCFFSVSKKNQILFEERDSNLLEKVNFIAKYSKKLGIFVILTLGQISFKGSPAIAKNGFSKKQNTEIVCVDQRNLDIIPFPFIQNENFVKKDELQIQLFPGRKNFGTLKKESDVFLRNNEKETKKEFEKSNLRLKGGENNPQNKNKNKSVLEAETLLFNKVQLTLKEKLILLTDINVLKAVLRILFEQFVNTLKNISTTEEISKTITKHPIKIVVSGVIVWNRKLVFNLVSNRDFRQSILDGVMSQVRLKLCLPPTCEVNQNDMTKCLEVIKDINLMHEEKQAFLEKRIEIRNKVVHRQEKQVRLQKETNENLHEKLQKTKDQLNIQVDANVNLKMTENSLTQKLIKTNQHLEICLKKGEKEKPSSQIVSTSQPRRAGTIQPEKVLNIMEKPRFQERKERIENERKMKKEAMEKEEQKDLEKNQQEEQQNLEKE